MLTFNVIETTSLWSGTILDRKTIEAINVIEAIKQINKKEQPKHIIRIELINGFLLAYFDESWIFDFFIWE